MGDNSNMGDISSSVINNYNNIELSSSQIREQDNIILKIRESQESDVMDDDNNFSSSVNRNSDIASNLADDDLDLLSEPSDSSISDDDSDCQNIHTHKPGSNRKRVNYKKLSYNDVRKQINRYYDLDFSQRYSSALDILASYLKGQKIIYMEARYYTLVLLYIFTIPSIFISAFCAVGQYQLEEFEWGKYLLSGFNGLLTFFISAANFMKFDAATQAYKITAHQYDKLQSYVEFQSGKLLLFNNNYKKIVKQKCKYRGGFSSHKFTSSTCFSGLLWCRLCSR